MKACSKPSAVNARSLSGLETPYLSLRQSPAPPSRQKDSNGPSPAFRSLVIVSINFVLVYAITWGAQVAVNRRTAKAINEKIQSEETDSHHERH